MCPPFSLYLFSIFRKFFCGKINCLKNNTISICRLFLKDFCIKFLHHGYNNLLYAVKVFINFSSAMSCHRDVSIVCLNSLVNIRLFILDIQTCFLMRFIHINISCKLFICKQLNVCVKEDRFSSSLNSKSPFSKPLYSVHCFEHSYMIICINGL